MAHGDKFKVLDRLYKPTKCNCEDLNTLADDKSKLLISNEELEAWVREIYLSGKGTIHKPTVRKVARHYWKAVTSAYGKKLTDENLDAADKIMLQHLSNNCYTFSAAKNKTHLQQLTALINNKGRVREWKDYYKEALKLNLKINKTWLKTEYDLAIAGGTMASKWVEFEKAPETILKYSTVGDDRVRAAHRALDGVTLPLNHPFWETAYPPNGFKCRCDVDRLPYKATVTPDDKIPGIGTDEIPSMFQTNLAKSKLVFPKNHPYYK